MRAFCTKAETPPLPAPLLPPLLSSAWKAKRADPARPPPKGNMGDEEEEAALAEDEAAEDDAVAVAEDPEEEEGREAIRLAAALPLTCILFYYTRV